MEASVDSNQGRKCQCLPKDLFRALLNKALGKPQATVEKNLISEFRKAGIYLSQSGSSSCWCWLLSYKLEKSKGVLLSVIAERNSLYHPVRVLALKQWEVPIKNLLTYVAARDEHPEKEVLFLLLLPLETARYHLTIWKKKQTKLKYLTWKIKCKNHSLTIKTQPPR